MSLVSNTLDALYNGVNQQAAEHRLDTQVEEMVNAFPTLDKGLLKRNPTTKMDLSQDITFSADMWSYAYDRGLAGGDEEKYSINITDGHLEIINVMNGDVYKDGNGLTFEAASEDYLFPFAGMNGYAATTVKDTTFLVNKTIVPKILGEDDSGSTVAYHAVELQMKDSTGLYAPYAKTVTNDTIQDCGYGSGTVDRRYETFYNGSTVVTVDGKDVLIASNHSYKSSCLKEMYCHDYSGVSGGGTRTCIDSRVYPSLSYASYSSMVYTRLSAELGTGYKVTFDSSHVITIKRLDESPCVVTYDVTVGGGTIVKTDYIVSATDVILNEIPLQGSDDYLKQGYVWLEIANASSAYTYDVDIKMETDATTYNYSVSDVKTTGAATKMATAINNGGVFTAEAKGSVVQITSPNVLEEVEASDSYGNQASSSWIYKVQFTTDLPKNMGFQDAVVLVTGSGDNTFASFWLAYNGSAWEETKSPTEVNIIDGSTMPHILVRDADGNFTVKEYAEWQEMKVGDADSNPAPSFIGEAIKDIFFFKNRLGFITATTVVMSEVGEYGNFWRTTTAAVLDSDYIDATVDANTVVSLEFATYLQDAVMLFADKAQFKLEGGRVLSPKDVQISKTSAYDMNMNIRPIYLNDKVFFASKRGNHTAIMEYRISPNNDTVEGIDITAHVQSYIPSDITRLTGSSSGNMLFITCAEQDDTIWVYKYFDNGDSRVQSAWFKWMFNGSIHSGFSLGDNLNLLITRSNSLAATDWVVGTGIWDNSKLWDNSKVWVMEPSSLTTRDQFEIMPIAPILHDGVFMDDAGSDDEAIIKTLVALGEWVHATRTGKDIRGHLKMKTAMITSEEGSQFRILVADTKRNTLRAIKSKYTVGRKPMIYGDARYTRLFIESQFSTGFRINSVSLEGALTKRDTKTN